MDQNIIQKAKSAVLKTFQDIRTKTINTPIAKNVQSVFYGQGYQAPAQKALPSLNYFNDLKTGTLKSGIKPLDAVGQSMGSYVQNRYIEPVLNAPQSASMLFGKNKTLGERGMGALGLGAAIATPFIDPIQDVAMPVYDFVKGFRSSNIRGGSIAENMKTGIKSLTMENPVGLGDALAKDGGTRQNFLNLAELPLVIAAGSMNSKAQATRNARRIFIDNNSKSIDEVLKLTRKAELSFKPTYRVAGNKKGLSVSEYKKVEDMAQEIIPQVIKAKEIQALKRSNPSEWYKIVNTYIQEQVVDAFNPEMNIGLKAKNLRKLEDFPEIGLKPSKGLTPEVNPLTAEARKYKSAEEFVKAQQFKKISTENPMTDSYHTGIRSASDIKTFKETLLDEESFSNPDFTKKMAEQALKIGEVTVYSSKPLDKSMSQFVTPSKMMASDYAGNGNVYSKKVSVDDVAWINGDEGNFVGKSQLTDIYNQSRSTPEVKPKIKLTPEVPLGQKERKFITSVQEAPNVVNPVKLKVKGMYTPKPNTQLMGEAQALLQDGASINFKQVKNVDQKVAATIQEAINQQKAGNHQAAANLFNNLSEQGTELGRGVQAFSLLKNMSPESIALSVAGRIKKYNQTAKIKIPELTGEQSKLIAEKMQEADLLKGREKNIALNELNNTINSFIPSSLADKALTVWKAGLLTSLRTHERNFVGNTIHGVLETAKDVPGSLADIALSKVTGKRTLTPTIKGLGEFGSKSTAQQMKDLVSKGYDPSEQINKFDHKQINWGKNPLEQGLKKYTDIVFRSLGAADKPFYNSAYARSLYNQAGAEAINAGKRGNTKFIENLVKNPTELMLKNAISDANVATFKDKNIATNTVNALKRGMGEGWGKVVGEVTMPFTGVPSSILGQITAYSPIGLIKGISTAGKVSLQNLPELQRQAAQEIGRGVMGSGIFALGAYLMNKGLISGQPKDATEAKQWELENKPRNSILIGGKWRSLNSIGPESVVFLAGSKLNQEMNDPEGSLSNYAVKLGKDYLDQSFVQGLQGPINAITDPNRYAKSYVGQLLSSPIPNIIKDVAKATDKSARESNTAFDYFKQGIPGEALGLGRKSLVEKRDVLGNIIPQEPTGLNAFVDLFNSKTPVVNNVVSELSRLNSVGENATPSKLSSSQTILKQKVKLTFDELNKLEKGAGEAVTFALNELISDPNYQNLTDEEKSQSIDKVVTSTRTKYKNLNAGEITPSISAPQTQAQTGKKYSYVDDTGNYKEVNLNPIVKPELTGQKELDKLKLSQYYSKITSQKTAISKLQDEGQITAVEAEDLLGKLISQSKSAKKASVKKPKKIAVKKITLKKISMPKVKQIKLKAFKIPKAKTVKLAKLKKPKTLKLKTISYKK